MSKLVVLGALLLAAAVANTTAIAAQERQRVGVVFAVPTTVGLEWELGSRLAIRPDCSFSWTSTDSASALGSFDTKDLTVGVSALFYVRHWSLLRAYVSPRFSHQLSHGDGSFAAGTRTQSLFSGSFGAQYELGPRFGVFAEAGVEYGRGRYSGGAAGVTKSTSFSNRAALGAILFF